MASEEVVFVPMFINAYINYGQRLRTDPSNRAYLAPLTTPNYQALQMDKGLVQHDIFDDLRDPPYLATADRARALDSRCGIYVHWSIPKHYRRGIAGSASGQMDMIAEKKRAGYNNPTSDGGNPEFHELPNRWVVVRRILADEGQQNHPVVRKDNMGNLQDSWYSSQSNPADSTIGAVYHIFVIESDCVRHIQDVPAGEDVEMTTSPYIDSDLAPSQQGQTFLGKNTDLLDWNPDTIPPASSGISLTVDKAANPYFADYQPQNAGVLSFFDDMSFVDDIGRGWFVNCYVSYYVFGYHTTNVADPLSIDSSLTQTTLDRLLALGLEPQNPGVTASLNSATSMKTVCHGQYYMIPWKNPLRNQPDMDISHPADEIQMEFRMSHPVAIGTNALDAMFAWLKSIPNDVHDTGLPSEDVVSATMIRKNLMKIQTLILDLNDDLDSQLQAEDLLATNNFIPSPQGKWWLSQDNGAGGMPDQILIDALQAINGKQARVNALLREQKRLQSEMFDIWWTYICDRSYGDETELRDRAQAASEAILDTKSVILDNLDPIGNGLIKDLSDEIDQQIADLGSTITLKETTEPAFYMQRDPTLFVAGLRSAWPNDWNENLPVRTTEQLSKRPASATDVDNVNFKSPLAPTLSTKMPPVLQDPVLNLMQDCTEYWPNGTPDVSSPKYYMHGDRFLGPNGWFPLFIEWEIEYYHIPFEMWNFAPQGPEARVGYRLRQDGDISTDQIQGDVRIINGRCPIVPQASSILETTIRQAFERIGAANLPTDIDTEAIKAQARNLDTVSTPMTGLFNQLVTRMQGTILKPYKLDQNGWPEWISGADVVGQELSIDAKDIFLIGDGPTTTPFASLNSISADPNQYTPFKPCTHGQFRFTKFNIIDKFGQVVQGVGKAPTTTNTSNTPPLTTQPLFPCLGEAYSVDGNVDNSQATMRDSGAKTVFPRNDEMCEFVQLPPSINQNARINADFVMDGAPDKAGSPIVRFAQEYDDPVSGWLVLNYANASIQIFTPDGVFIREYNALAAAKGAVISSPFTTDPSTTDDGDLLLSWFMRTFPVAGYLSELFSTLSQAVSAVQANPTSYSESMLSIFGRPLALVSLGVSLELADPPLKNTCTTAPASWSYKEGSHDTVTQYSFPIKIGDKDNIFDGLYGYFSPTDNTDSSGTYTPDFRKFNCYYTDPSEDNQFCFTPDINGVKLRPFYADPHSTDDLSVQRLNQTTIIPAIVDPFTPVHLYSAILPIKTLQIPPWAVSNGLARICTFFRMGPILVPSDVPTYDPNKVVEEDYRLGDKTGAPASNGSVQVPAVGLGEWAWLQPYRDDSGNSKLNLLDVDAIPNKPQWAPAPYVAIEGFLQQKTPFQAPSTSAAN